MKQIYLNTLLIIFTVLSLTSCSPKYRFVTKGLPETDSSYLITNRGKRIDANEIVVRRSGLKVDGKKMDIDDYKIIKSKKMYFVVDEDKLFLTEIYGKINLLYTLSYSYTYTGGGYSSAVGGRGGVAGGSAAPTTTVTKSYYLQKQGSPNVDRLTRSTFLDYVSDNEDAVAKVKAHYIWQYTTYASFLGYVGSTIYLVAAVGNNNGSGNYAAPIALFGGSAVLHLTLSSIADHKLRKAIYIYNEME